MVLVALATLSIPYFLRAQNAATEGTTATANPVLPDGKEKLNLHTPAPSATL